MLDLVKLTGGPGSLQLLALLVALGLVVRWRWPRTGRLVRIWLAVVCSSYLVLALPMVSVAIDGLVPVVTAPAQDGLSRPDTLVVFDGDNRRGRLAEALSIWRSASPSRVIVSGKDWLIDELRTAGVPESTLEQESVSKTTRDQVEWLERFERQDRDEGAFVVVSRLQAARTGALMSRARLRSTLVPAPLDVEPARSGWMRFVPSYAALRLSRDAFYEYAALKYYRSSGWID